MLPALNCLTLLTLNLPPFTIGTWASFSYWLIDQSFALIDAGLESRSIGLRCRTRDCARKSPTPKAAEPKIRGVRREWLKRPGVKRNAIATDDGEREPDVFVGGRRVRMFSMCYGHTCTCSLMDRGMFWRELSKPMTWATFLEA